VKVGDLVWQDRDPGGVCLILDIIYVETPESKAKGWGEIDYPILKIHSPIEGIIQDPSYYYEELSDCK